jgi:8-oxo-dGTP diphosphatase
MNESKHGLFQITQKVFIRKGSELLVLKDHKSGQGDLPGGRMNQSEFFEDWLISLDRELKEEMGEQFIVNIFAEPIFVHKHLVNDGNHPCLIVAYKGEFQSGDIQISDEHDYFKWVDIYTFNPSEFFSEYMLDAVNLYLLREKI